MNPHALTAIKYNFLRLGKISIALVFVAGVALSQTKTSPPTLSQRVTSTDSSQTEAQELRKQQLSIFQAVTFRRTVDGIKSMQEPGLRLSVRILFLSYIWQGQESNENKKAAAKIAAEAITDYNEHSGEIAPYMASALLGKLGNLLEKYAPKLNESFNANTKERQTEEDNINALLQTKGGDVRAAQRIRQLLAQGQEIGGLSFYLDNLREMKSKEFEPLLEDITALARRQLVSWDALFWLDELYLPPELPPALKRRFLTMIVTRLQTDLTAGAPQRMAYKLLIQVLPFISSLTPELYSQALAQHTALRAAFAEEEAEEARNKRLAESSTPVEDLIAEAEAAKSKPERNELFSAAAQLALKLNKFELCLAALERIDADAAAKTPHFREFNDQLLRQFVKTTLEAKERKLAEKGARLIFFPLARVEAFNLLIFFQAKEAQPEAAQRLLLETIKIANSIPDQTGKARSFLLLSSTCSQVDTTKKPEMLQAAVKALNNIDRPEASANGDNLPYFQYIHDLDNLGYQLAKTFKELTKADESAALALAEQLKKPDLQTFARLGIIIGLDNLITPKTPKTP